MCEHVCEARVNPGCLSWYSPSFKTGSLAGLERIYQIRLAIQAPVIHHLYLPVLGLQALTTTPECLCFQVSSRGWDSGLYMFARQALCQVSYPSVSLYHSPPTPATTHSSMVHKRLPLSVWSSEILIDILGQPLAITRLSWTEFG